ncbi:GNAT family N-acetyltransferase [Aspergillus clavatus NRRL 1]|uniref:N-acetyltransferase domain-containing protein n=1 Tax=Aspergillus clavatus (strain ATCC 1007 / CBS 513.65 / DSM 816 / NCTC 3887 / NRRL 1 / QM 1276 / 107) TaxID=344612 RepID=A1CNV9_ASPCL|nr:uncharacterized protein ACLA_020370 [Aspergillus clavatus NRRL 1]EAW07330.1 conserved hypothetical protein [Aspergillus clavatus NRRL 1]
MENPQVKSDSNGSDEVVLHRKRDSLDGFQNRRPSKGTHAYFNTRNEAPSRSMQRGPRRNTNDTQREPAEIGNGVGPGGSGMQDKTPSITQKGARKGPPQEALDELKRLQEEIVLKAHLNRHKNFDDSTANPESLVKCRDGPGTDPNSDFYNGITQCRLSTRPHGESARSTRTYRFDSFRGEAERFAAQWEFYANSPSAYPTIVDGKVSLASRPGPDQDHLHTQKKGLLYPNLKFDQKPVGHMPVEVPENQWADLFFVDWEFRPRACSSFEGFRDWFRRWFGMLSEIDYYIDVYHEAFFDGTAHMDGAQSCFIPDLDHPVAHLDVRDEETRLHCHETAEGYCHNLKLHIKKAEDEERVRRRMARQSYIEGLKNSSPPDPKSPRANVYLRIGEHHDIPGLLPICNWYTQNSNLSTRIAHIDDAILRQRIDDCRNARLPFLVAAERGTVDDNSTEKILGYAMATESLGHGAAGQFTAELEVFIKPDQKRRGIGKCLLDKLIEACDATYIPKRGYLCDASCEDRTGLYAGGSRTIKRLVFAIAYSKSDVLHVKWLLDWLEREYEFEEQGVLKGARVKSGKFLDVSYLVRRVGYDDGDTFKA